MSTGSTQPAASQPTNVIPPRAAAAPKQSANANTEWQVLEVKKLKARQAAQKQLAILHAGTTFLVPNVPGAPAVQLDATEWVTGNDGVLDTVINARLISIPLAFQGASGANVLDANQKPIGSVTFPAGKAVVDATNFSFGPGLLVFSASALAEVTPPTNQPTAAATPESSPPQSATAAETTKPEEASPTSEAQTTPAAEPPAKS